MAIVKIDYADVTDVLTGNVQTPFEIDSYTNTTIPKLQVGRCEEIGGSLYRVETSEVTPTGSPADGTVYLYVEDLGASIATTLSATAPTFSPTLGGYYNGNAKAVFVCNKATSTYTKKARIITHQGVSFGGDTTVRRTASGELSIDGNLTVNGEIDSDNITLKASVSFIGYQGTPLVIGGGGQTAICAMSHNRIAFIDNVGNLLKAFDFDGITWALVGSGLSITSLANSSLCRLSSSRIAFIDDSVESLRAYDFNGSTWSLVGSGLSIAGITKATITALSSTRIAFVETTSDELRAYDFNGSTWSLTGSGLNLGAISEPLVVTLSSTRVAILRNDNILEAYDFSGTAWTLVGNTTIPHTYSTSDLTALSNKRVCIASSSLNGSGTDVLAVYDFDGTEWSLVGSNYSVGFNFNDPSITALSSNKIVTIGNSTDNVYVYNLIFENSLF
jgi:hypothetical protein